MQQRIMSSWPEHFGSKDPYTLVTLTLPHPLVTFRLSPCVERDLLGRTWVSSLGSEVK
jgi:hypothetical protein